MHNFSPNAINLLQKYVNLDQYNSKQRKCVLLFPTQDIYQTFLNHDDLTQKLIALFRIKFDPRTEKDNRLEKYEQTKIALSERVSKLIDKVERNIFTESLKFLDSILTTSYFIATKTGLAFRLKTDLLDKKYYPELPYAIFFIVGKDYRFFHVRWRDVARGG